MSVHGRSFIAGLFVPVAIIAALLFITDYSELLTSIEQLRAQGNSVNRSSIWQQQTGPPAQHGVAQWQQLNLTSNWTFPGVTCCSSEGDEPLCPWCNKTFTTRYPLQEAEHFQRSFIPGGPCAMPPGLLQKLKTGQPVKINVVGGSMTAGKFCNDKGRHQSACAWPARMRDRLLQLFPRADITVTNMAKPGFSYTSFMSTGSVHDLIDADVLFIDLQVNSQVYGDQFKEMEETDEFIFQALSLAYEQQTHLGILFVESFRVCSKQIEDCNRHCPAHRQAHMTYNHTGKPTKYSWCNRWWTIASTERPIVRHYKLPIASYRDAVWPDIAAPSPLLPCYWNGLSHADAIGHNMVGDVVTYGFLRAIGMDPQAAQGTNSNTQQQSSGAARPGPEGATCSPLQPPIKFHQQLLPRKYCAAPKPGGPGVFMAAQQPQTFQPVAQTGCWRFVEDRPGKPGWICEEVPPQLHAANTSLPHISSTQGSAPAAHAAAAAGRAAGNGTQPGSAAPGKNAAASGTAVSKATPTRGTAAGNKTAPVHPTEAQKVVGGASAAKSAVPAANATTTELAAYPDAGSLLGTAVNASKATQPKVDATMRLLLSSADALQAGTNSSSSSSTIFFKVSFSSQPQLQLTYLTSYTSNMGVAEVLLFEAHVPVQQATKMQPVTKYLLDTRIKDKFSIPRTSVFVHPSSWRQWQHHPNAQQLAGSVKQGDYLVAIRLSQSNTTSIQKLKLLALSSC